MNTEQAFQNWWDKQKGRLPKVFQFMYRQGFEAGYDAARAEVPCPSIKPCSACDGTGRQLKASGNPQYPIGGTVDCLLCEGSGVTIA